MDHGGIVVDDLAAATELIKFHSLSYRGGNRKEPANAPGIRHVSFVVEDIDAVVSGLRARGAGLVGELAERIG